jgi:predicted enzyme related to lactoylglutathione lyase
MNDSITSFGGTAICVDDVPAALDFYRRAFGMRTRFFDEALQYGELETGASVVAFASHSLGAMLMPGAHARPETGRPAGVELGFITLDVPTAFAQAVAAGAVPLAEPKRMVWGATVAYLRAPEGTILGLSTPVSGNEPVSALEDQTPG